MALPPTSAAVGGGNYKCDSLRGGKSLGLSMLRSGFHVACGDLLSGQPTQRWRKGVDEWKEAETQARGKRTEGVGGGGWGGLVSGDLRGSR